MGAAQASIIGSDQRKANREVAVVGRSVIFKIKRCDGPGKPWRWESFKVPTEPGSNVISSLNWIAANPITANGKTTTPVVWDSSCLEEVCGACTMVINGRVRQSCSCLIDEYAPREGDEITLEPMEKFPVIRDLWVDRTRMFNALERVKAWVPIDGTYNLGPGPKESHDHQQMRYALSECMTCGCCVDACPQFSKQDDEKNWESSFIGPQAISQARLFNEHDTGKRLKDERMDTLTGPGGIQDCGNSQNCVKVCPKGIPLTESIAAIGRSATVHAIKNFFTGK
ncbi:MAG: succinate dehydrogenase iron-sulfur subunit [Phycisphaerales bacterium]|nr:succinate dehydrogenase iron-sulfur subunit [Phycisphaerales bacterium]